MKYIVIGASGLIGSNLIKMLVERGEEAVAVSRTPAQLSEKFPWIDKSEQWDGASTNDLAEIIDGADVVVNLAGEGIASKRWTAVQKQKIISSRKLVTSAVCQAIEKTGTRPSTLIQASATGFYQPQLHGRITETSPKGSNFLSEVCSLWEESAQKAKEFTRLIIIRTGVVLDKNGGALPLMVKPFRFYAGGHIGNGNQYVPWIHLEDEISAIHFLAENKQSQGAYNLSSPEPVTMRQFSKTIGQTINSPSWLHVPEFALRLMMGEMADEMLLASLPIYPERLLLEGFRFKYPDIESALTQILTS